MSEIPPFWFDKPGLAAWLLSPFSAVYGRIAARRMLMKPKAVSTVPVICIGNFVTGGAGKTPAAIALAKIARDIGLKPGFLSRGYGGSVNVPTLVASKTHNAKDVGDEPLLLSKIAPTIVSADRPAGAILLAERGVDLIIMDDGFQNPSLHKDYSLVVVDSRRGIGNGYCMPSGPLRAQLAAQLAATSALLLIGKSHSADKIVRPAAKMAKPIIEAAIRIKNPRVAKGKNLLAFAGISDPTKFYLSLEEAGAKRIEQVSFHDHHPFTALECKELMDRAKSEKLVLVTTEKDNERLSNMGEAQNELRKLSKILHVELVFENPKMIEMIIRQTMEKGHKFRRGLKV